jgi:predicted ATPase
MIKSLKIKHFKAHSDTMLDLSNLNILSGVNGVGKSSVIQALLLLRQSFESNVLQNGLQLNKPHCDIGNISDAIYQYSDDDIIEFAISLDGDVSKNWKFKAEGNNHSKNFIPRFENAPTEIENLSLFNEQFQYLSAARISPRESYPQDTYAVEVKRQLSLEKGQGELIGHFLHYYGKEKKEQIKFPSMRHPLEEHDDLLSQTTAWEREISPNVNIVPTATGKSYGLKYTFNKPGDITATNEFSAENVGFGMSYALPVIVALLSSAMNSLVLIENPEAHLHPKGQAELAKLIALAASNGIQIIVETHSEHIINGILVACKKYEEKGEGINRDLVKIFHFRRDDIKHCAIVETINILTEGKVDKQPEDFFEQTGKDLQYLLGF